MNGATPVFIEPDKFYQIDVDQIEAKITPRTKAVMVVHLYGQVAQMDRIVDLCLSYISQLFFLFPALSPPYDLV